MPVARLTCLVPVVVALLATFLVATAPVSAHPEDEFCVPGETPLDPQLCAALSALDKPGADDTDVARVLDAAGRERGFMQSFALYVSIGVRHILPAGLDHILFVLALFLASSSLAALLWQISAFTVAHTFTLGLAATGVVSPPASIVEPLIAATIALVAVENIASPKLPRWRIAVVFLFGLVHGLGFAGFFGELGLPPGQFWSALVGFNVGVEIGQLSVVALAAAIALLARRGVPVLAVPGAWRRYIVIPASALIGLTGVAWTIERVAGTLS